MQLGVFAVIAVSSSVAIGYRAGDKAHSPDAAAQRAWHGKITKVARAGADKSGGVTLKKGKAESPGIEGAEVSEGTEIVTDARTRVRIDLDDGSSMVLDRGTQIAIESGPRTMRVKAGSIVADVAHIDNAPIAHLTTEHGEVGVLGTKFALTSAEDRTTVEVMRGVVELKDASANHVQVGAGQEGVAAKNAKLEIAPVNDLAQRLAFGERLGLAGAHNEDTDLPVSGLGELRARRPGKTDEKDHAVALSSHNVKVRIVGNVARTEIDEIFTNETNDELEGVYRFPLPPDAQIERLALEVDGKLIEGSFVDKAKGAAIFRGAIQNSIPKAPKPKEEIIWVPGPWHDPALLEWQRGGRFELRIFPIPKRGARRVVIAYTETVAPVAGMRRYVYPLPQSTSSEMKIGSFGVDVQVLGADTKLGVKAKGYEIAKAAANESGGDRFAQTMTNFVPSGDLTIEYGLADRATDVTAWGYTDPKPATDKVLEKGYVALALRPKLPGWTESKPRDVVIVVDSGRAMFGERYQRAKRLAVQVTQEMDRRDRVAVLACDVTCRAMPGGFDGAGSKRAHDVDAFLAGTEPDGATDLVGAVRAAAGIGGHDRTRDLRVVLVSDGIASAGYRRPERLSNEVRDVLTGPRDEVVAVPIGADADVLTLKEIARGGGGVVVPYSPGEMLETAALEVLNATYGIALRDVELTLPPGLTEAAPGTIAPIRAGGETIVTARLTGESVKGDAILRGKVGGQPFEARYPIDVQATSDAGNAFVPRLYAAARIADKERETNESSRAELVTLSQRHAVPSRFTSLLVLESEAMFTAFGIDRTARSPSWTGEAAAHGSEVATLARDEEDSAGALAGGDLSKDKKAGEEKADDSISEPRKRASLGDPLESSLGGTGSGFGGGGKGSSGPTTPQAPPPVTTPTAKPAPTASANAAPSADARESAAQAQRRPWDGGGRRGGRFMKRVWFRKASVSNGAPPAIASDKIALARAAVQAAPDERAKYKELVRLLSANAALDELGEVLARWASRDPLDPDAIAARADLAARSGDRERSLRILDGIASGASSASGDVGVIEALALAHERAGDRFAACAFRIAAAEVRSDVPAASLGAADVDRFARAVACERSDGRPAAADRWLASRKDKSGVETAALKFDALAKGAAAPTENTSFGDIVVDATWDSGPGVDVDVAVVDPAGNRLGWPTRSKNVRVTDATSRRHESLAVSSGSAGAFTIELVRAGGGTAPVTGTLSVRSFGERISVPFVLSGPVLQAARVQVRFESELVPADGPPELGFQAPPFDRGAAVRALASVSVVGCSTGSGPTGQGIVRVTFGPNGRVTSSNVVDAPFVGTSTGACVAGAYRRAMVPAFDPNQGSVTLQKGFVVPP